MSTSDYEPRYLELWRDAAAKEIALPMQSREDAFSFRHRLYRCRLAMKAENHPWYELAKTVSVSIQAQEDGGWNGLSGKETIKPGSPLRLLLRNPDQRFSQALADAGYEPPKAPLLD